MARYRTKTKLSSEFQRRKRKDKFRQETPEQYAIRLAIARENYYRRKSQETLYERELRLARQRHSSRLYQKRYKKRRQEMAKRQKLEKARLRRLENERKLPNFEHVELQPDESLELEREEVNIPTRYYADLDYSSVATVNQSHVCAVPTCPVKKSDNILLHSFPADEELREKWRAILKIEKQVTKSMRVCTLHFAPQDYFYQFESSRKVLKRRTLPSQNIPCSQNFSTSGNHFLAGMREINTSFQTSNVTPPQPGNHFLAGMRETNRPFPTSNITLQQPVNHFLGQTRETNPTFPTSNMILPHSENSVLAQTRETNNTLPNSNLNLQKLGIYLIAETREKNATFQNTNMTMPQPGLPNMLVQMREKNTNFLNSYINFLPAHNLSTQTREINTAFPTSNNVNLPENYFLGQTRETSPAFQTNNENPPKLETIVKTEKICEEEIVKEEFEVDIKMEDVMSFCKQEIKEEDEIIKQT